MMLTTIVFLPLIAALVLAMVPGRYAVVMRGTALLVTMIEALLGLLLFWRFDAAGGYQFVQTVPGLGSQLLGISCRLGVDGISVGLIMMGTIVAFAAACASWEITEREKEFYILLLLMTGGILGAFASLDLFFLYFFHELALVPTFIMIGVWGRGEQRNYAAFKITLYLSVGALIALIGLIALYLEAGGQTFDLETLVMQVAEKPLSLESQHLIFPLLLFGFGILVSLWPFHTWAPLGYASAPTATAMLHAGVLKKFGLYALIRVALPMMPEGARSWMHVLAFLCLGNLVYCGLVAMRQKNLNWLIGNSSVAHMGFVFLGIASLNVLGITGAVVVMIAHGFLAALAFGLGGYLHRQMRTLEIPEMGGLLQRLPFIGAALLMALLAGCGLPGFANFVGEVMVLFSIWDAFPVVTVLATWGALIIGAVYMLRAARNILHGPVPANQSAVADAGWWRRLPFVLLLAALLAFGCLPRLLTDRIKPAAEVVVAHVTRAGLPSRPSSKPAGTALLEQGKAPGEISRIE